MANDFTSKSNASIDRAVSESNSFEALREAVKRSLVQSGTIIRDPLDRYGVRATGQPTGEVVPDIPKVSAMLACSRVVYPFQNLRFVLTANSERELDQQEEQLKQAFQGRQ
jgi:hypothetical protein